MRAHRRIWKRDWSRFASARRPRRSWPIASAAWSSREWESFEVQMRRKLEESGAGQAKTAAPDKVPAGYDANVQEYTRKLSNGK